MNNLTDFGGGSVLPSLVATKKSLRGCRISKYFCWAAAPFYAKMASKLITILMPFFTSAVRP